jgi:enoyl-CoA hydratase/carnithine racemase
MPDIVLLDRGAVAEIRLNRVSARNALFRRWRCPTHATRSAAASTPVWRAGLDIEDSAWRATVFSDDRREGVRAFVERRRPDWP